MRVTNSMLSSDMLLNMNRNMMNLNDLYNQMSTGKRIQFPSDNPILASRALTFRTNVSETEQFQQNVNQGVSWMTTTQNAFSNVMDIVRQIRTLCVQGASGENTYTDKQAIAGNIAQLASQLGSEMNAAYGGRYVFSGCRTDCPPYYTDDSADSYTVNQSFTAGDIENINSYQKLDDPAVGNVTPPVTYPASVLKLAYTNVDADPPISVTIGGSPAAVNTTGLKDPGAYNPDPDGVNFIPETGELVLGSNVAASIGSGQIGVQYNKTGFKAGEPNPIVNFTCTALNGQNAGKTYTMDNQDLRYQFSTNVMIPVNSLAKNVYSDKMYADLNALLAVVNSVKTSDPTQLAAALKRQNPGMTDDQINTMVHDQLTRENSDINKVLQGRFNDMIGLMDKYSSGISVQQSDLGSRMKRLDLLSSRLAQDGINYKTLLSQNEDADISETAMNLSAAQAVYMASLKAGAGIIQQTLANYIG